jgi:predicted ATPase/DNA-binding SARP family transcriptional activator
MLGETAPVLTIAVLGRIEVRRAGVPVAVPGGLSAQLLVRLALDAGRPVSADRLVADLWPGGAGRNTLQAKVSQLRRALGAEVLAPGYTLVVAPAAVDAHEALRLADACAALLAAGDAVGAARCAAEGLALFDAEVLPGAGEWAVPHRARLEEARLRLTEDGLAARARLGEAPVGELEELVGAHPLRERLWAQLVTALYRAGRQADALAAHRRITRLLAEELGVDPGPELREAGARVLAHDPALAPRRTGNLPSPASGLVGRSADLAAVGAALTTHRLVTLVGPAGVGKTRLALEVAGAAPLEEAWLVRFESARTAADLLPALAESVPGVESVGDLRGREALLVLDNCEQVAEAVAAFAAEVLDAAPGVRLLATSQRSLGLPGEVVVPLAPLAEADAAALFAQCAAARGSRVEPGADLTRLCAALDGLPLALELAAARTRILSVPEIVRRLDDRFALLADPTSTAPERRRTLTAALSWSYDLLFPDDQRGLQALAAFPAGATLPALEHVLSRVDVPAQAVLDVVERLADRSLVAVDPGGPATRYRLLDSVRAHAAARAREDGLAGRLADALVDWVATLAADVDAHVRGPGQAERVAAVAAERATIDAALAHDPARAPQIAADLGWAWILLDDAAAAPRLRTARLRLPAPDADPRAPGPRGAGEPGGGGLAGGGSGTDPALRVRLLLLEAWAEAMSGELEPALAALALAEAEAGPEEVDLVRWHAGFVLFQSAPAEALAALAACTVSGWWEGGRLLLAAFAHLALGDVGAGREACEAAIAIITPLRDAWGLQHAEAALGRVAQAEGRFAAAAEHHARAADAAGRLGFPGALGLHLVHLGRARLAGGEPAESTLDEAVAAAERAGDRRLLAMARVARAEASLAAGDRATARALLTEAVRWYTAAGGGEGADHAAALLASV